MSARDELINFLKEFQDDFKRYQVVSKLKDRMDEIKYFHNEFLERAMNAINPPANVSKATIVPMLSEATYSELLVLAKALRKAALEHIAGLQQSPQTKRNFTAAMKAFDKMLVDNQIVAASLLQADPHLRVMMKEYSEQSKAFELQYRLNKDKAILMQHVKSKSILNHVSDLFSSLYELRQGKRPIDEEALLKKVKDFEAKAKNYLESSVEHLDPAMDELDQPENITAKQYFEAKEAVELIVDPPQEMNRNNNNNNNNRI